MDAALEIARQTGVLLRREAVELGMDDRALARAVRDDDLTRIRHGMYALPGPWKELFPEGRHRILCEGVRRRFAGTPIAFTHASALVLQGISVWGDDLDQVHVTRLDGHHGRTEHGIVHHRGVLPEEDLLEVDDWLTSVPDRAVVEHICRNNVEAGLVSADSALHQEVVDLDQVVARFEQFQSWPDRRSGHIVLRLADARAESVGETRGRFFCWKHGLPAPDLQFEVRDEYGNLIGRTDFVWHNYCLCGEFDGMQKYGRLLKPGQTIQDVVATEKTREDKIREITDYRFLRWTWGDYSRPDQLLRRFQDKLGTRVA